MHGAAITTDISIENETFERAVSLSCSASAAATVGTRTVANAVFSASGRLTRMSVLLRIPLRRTASSLSFAALGNDAASAVLTPRTTVTISITRLSDATIEPREIGIETIRIVFAVLNALVFILTGGAAFIFSEMDFLCAPRKQNRYAQLRNVESVVESVAPAAIYSGFAPAIASTIRIVDTLFKNCSSTWLVFVACIFCCPAKKPRITLETDTNIIAGESARIV